MVICESHYMPEGSTINHDADRWYAANERQLSECERRYINTVGCVEYRLSPEGRDKTLRNNAYVRINDVVSFDRILFTNYFYRPAIYMSNIRSVGITQQDLLVSAEIMRWLVQTHRPRLIVVASVTTAGPPARSVLTKIGVRHCVIHHPMSRHHKFHHQAVECLRSIDS